MQAARQATQSESEVLRLRKLGVEEEERERKRREDELSRLYAALDAARLEATRSREAEAEAQRKREREVEEMRVRGEERLQRERERVAELERVLAQNTSAIGESSRNENDERDEKKSVASSLENLVAELRVALSDKETQVDRFRKELLVQEERIGDQNELIRKLQQAEITANPASISFGNGYASSPSGEGSASTESAGVVGILQDQRDRFRRRMLELEQELEVVSGKEKRSREVLEKTRSENVALAERVRTLRSATRDVGSTLSAGIAAGSRSPLQIMLRFVSANSMARSALIIYISALHFLVLASLTSFSHGDSAQSAALRKGVE